MDHSPEERPTERTDGGVAEAPDAPFAQSAGPPGTERTREVAVTDGADSAWAAPTRVALDDWADDVRQANLSVALERLEQRTDLDDAERAAVARCSRALVDALLRCPHWRLSAGAVDVDDSAGAVDVAESPRDVDVDELVRDVFDLES